MLSYEGDMIMQPDVAGFLAEQKSAFAAFCQSNDAAGALEQKTWECSLGNVEVLRWQGQVFEKASAIYCDLEIDTPPVLARTVENPPERMRALVLEINLFPLNPHIPKGYIELRVHSIGKTILAGGTDLFPYTAEDEPVSLFASRVTQVCHEHRQDYEALRKVRADFFRSKFTGEKVGSHAGIYFFSLAEEQFPFYCALAETFFDAYGKIVQQRRQMPVTEDERRHMLTLHGQWAQWILLEDEGTRFGLEKGIPADALLGAILPPLAIF